MITVLMGATLRDAQYWCDEQQIPRSEIGKTVLPSSFDPGLLRGRRERVRMVYGAFTGSHRNFAEWHRGMTALNQMNPTEQETP